MEWQDVGVEKKMEAFGKQGFTILIYGSKTKQRIIDQYPAVSERRQSEWGEVPMNTHILENEKLRVTVSDKGAELISVIDKASKRERIWNADPAIWNRHAPILFPFVGKLTDGKYRVGDREYSMKTQHGFARDMEFVCVEDTGNCVSHQLCASDVTKKMYPYDFCLTVRHSLNPEQPGVLDISWKIENLEDGRMFYAIGGHPGFLPPEGLEKENCGVLFPGKQELTYFSASKAGYAIPDSKHRLVTDSGFAMWKEDIPDTWIFEDQGVNCVGLSGPDRSPFVLVRCAAFPILAVWANPDGPFICLEPWFGRTDDEGFHGTLEEKAGMQSLNAHEKKQITWSIDFCV